MSTKFKISESYYRKLTYVPVIFFSIYLLMSNLLSIRSFLIDFLFLLCSGFLVVIVPYLFPPLGDAPQETISSDKSKLPLYIEHFRGKNKYLIIARNKEGTIVGMSQNSERFWGYKSESVLNEKGLFVEMVHPSSREMIKDYLLDEKTSDEGGIITESYELRKADGEMIFVKEHRIDVLQDYDNLEIVLLSDESDLKDLIIKNENMDEFFSKIFKNIPDIFCVINFETDTYIELNSYFVKMLGKKRKEVAGKSIKDFNLFSDLGLYFDFKNKLQNDGGVFNQEISLEVGKEKKITKGLISGTLITMDEKNLGLVTLKLLPEHFFKDGSEYLKNTEKFPLKYGHFNWKILSNDFNLDDSVFDILRLNRNEVKNLNIDLFFRSAIAEDKKLFEDFTDRLTEGSGAFSLSFNVEDHRNKGKVPLLLMANVENDKNIPSVVKGIIIEMV